MLSLFLAASNDKLAMAWLATLANSGNSTLVFALSYLVF